MGSSTAFAAKLISAGSTVRQCVLKRLTSAAPWVVVTQLFIGLGWLRAAVEKAIDSAWWTGDVVDKFAVTQSEFALAWYQPFLDLVQSLAPLIALMVIIGELVAAITLTVGRRVGVGLAIGIFLNVHFLAAGVVDPSVFYLLAQGALALAYIEAARTRRTTERLTLLARFATFIAVINLPFIRTLHPARVIEDPAIMMVFGGALTTLACRLALWSDESLEGKTAVQTPPPTPDIDLTAMAAGVRSSKPGGRARNLRVRGRVDPTDGDLIRSK